MAANRCPTNPTLPTGPGRLFAFCFCLLAASLAGCAGEGGGTVAAGDSPMGFGFATLPEPERPVAEPAAAPNAAAGGATAPESSESSPDGQGVEVVDVYVFSGKVVGASAPMVGGSGPALHQVPVAKESTFEAPPGTLALQFALDRIDGSGAGRIEVIGPDGSLAYRSFTWHNIGHPVGGGGCTGCAPWTAEQALPGTYLVRYYVAGAYTLAFRGNATVAPSDAPATQPLADEPTVPRLAPVVFSGSVIAPDPHYQAHGTCPSYDGWYGDLSMYVTWDSFGSTGRYAGWSYSFDVPGLVADFGADALGPQPTGTVPVGDTVLRVCSASASNTAFKLTLTPPGSVILAGRITAPHPEWYDNGVCSGAAGWVYDAVPTEPTRVHFRLRQDHTNWTFAFNVPGLVAGFHDGYAHFAQASGTVPPGATFATVCSPSKANADFELVLTPAVA